MILLYLIFAYLIVSSFFLGFFTCVRLDRDDLDFLTAVMLSFLWPLTVGYIGLIMYLAPTAKTGDEE